MIGIRTGWLWPMEPRLGVVSKWDEGDERVITGKQVQGGYRVYRPGTLETVQPSGPVCLCCP